MPLKLAHVRGAAWALAVIGAAVGAIVAGRGQAQSAPPSVVGACSIDAISAGKAEFPVVPVGARLMVDGWATDTMARPGRDVFVHVLNERGVVVASVRRASTVIRPDVAMAFKAPGLEKSGFHVEIPTQGLAPGKYELMVESRQEDLHAACRPGTTMYLK